MLREFKGDLFSSNAPAIGHGVNCKGVMGAGIAKTFKYKYPDMYSQYNAFCMARLLNPGDVYPWLARRNRIILNIASQDWPGPNAQMMWLVNGVYAAMGACEKLNCDRLALPQIGCGIGGLEWEKVKARLDYLDGTYGVTLEIWSL